MSGNAAIKVGDVVAFTLAASKRAAGRVTEIPGAIGVNGRLLVRVAYSLGEDFSLETIFPADALRLVRRGSGVTVGDVVRFTLGRRLVTGRVTQERGHIGVRKRCVYRIAYAIGQFEAETELPDGDFDVVWEESIAD